MSRNHLSEETSPYLLQHADNPVHWYGWGPEALAAAKDQDKPILLSVGYAACHWCHVMAHESFESKAIATQMNELFVNIKVDRKEQTDVNSIHQSALGMMGRQSFHSPPCSNIRGGPTGKPVRHCFAAPSPKRSIISVYGGPQAFGGAYGTSPIPITLPITGP